MSRTTSRTAPLLVAATVLAVLFMSYEPFPVGVAQDDGLYMILAKALATGRGYRFINLPGSPAGVHYPPGYPLLLAALSRVTSGIPGNPLVFAVANMALLATAAAFSYVLARRIGVKTAVACACSLAGFLMPPAMWMNTTLLSEPLWLALAMPWLVWAHDVERTHADDGIDARTALALGMSAGCIALVRTQAATLVLALVVVLAARRQWRSAGLVMLAAAAVLLPWQIWVGRHSGEVPSAISAKYGPYAAWYAEGLRAEGFHLIIRTISRNTASAFMILRGIFAPVGGLLAVLVLGLPGVAALRRLARRSPVLLVALLSHAALILVWPFEPRRFIWTSWPFVALWLTAGITELLEEHGAGQHIPDARTKRFRVARGLVLADSALLVIGAVATSASMLWTGAYRTIARGQARRINPTVEWVQRHTPPGTLIASEDETAVFLYTGRPAVPVSSFSAADYARGERSSVGTLDGVMARYRPAVAILSWDKSVEAALRLSSGRGSVLRVADRTASSIVFERVPDGAQRPASEAALSSAVR